MQSPSDDQQRFLLTHLISLTLALPYRFVPKGLRNHYNLFPGIFLIYFCFGRDANSFLLFAISSFLICRFTDGKYIQYVTMCLSLLFLSFTHLSRQISDYGGYKIDISGPFMIAFQKVTSLGFCIHDGFKIATSDTVAAVPHSAKLSTEVVPNEDSDHEDNDDTSLRRLTKSKRVLVEDKPKSDVKLKSLVLTDEQMQYSIEKRPNFIEFMGYFFHFPSISCGPFMYFNDYRDFVNYPYSKDLPPGRFQATFRKVFTSLTCVVLMLILLPKFDIDLLKSHKFLVELTLFSRYYYIMIFTMLSRLKYYIAWYLGEASTNLTGLGFNGYDENKNPKWDLIANMDLWHFETCLNFRSAIIAWNKSTQTWLRRTAYERVPKHLAVLSTYCLSALWHGFYPGYYMTFLSGAFFTYAARSGRKTIRPFFQRGKFLSRLYDVITFILTRLTIAYIAFPFVILNFKQSWAIYKSLYFSMHALGLAVIGLGLAMPKK